MLALILAAALQPMDEMAARFMRQCDRPKPTELCGAYMTGFIDAAAAHVAMAEHLKFGPGAFAVACLPVAPQKIDTERVRAAAVAAMKRRAPNRPHYMAVLDALTEVYPCARKSTAGTGGR